MHDLLHACGNQVLCVCTAGIAYLAPCPDNDCLCHVSVVPSHGLWNVVKETMGC